MKHIIYYCLLPFIYLLAILPFPVLYGVSNFMFVVLFHLIGYRRKVVETNLRNAFPHKSNEEILLISKNYYRYLCDITLETFKTLVFSKKTALERCQMDESARQLFASYAEKGQSIIIVMGHYGNWEWGGNTFSLTCKQQLYVIYHQLSNPHFDKLMMNMRTRFGAIPIEMKETFKEMTKHRSEVTATAFIADQTPSPESGYWTTFLNQDTPVFRGTERIAQKLNFPVVYLSIKRQKRGFYVLFAETIFDDPANTTEGQITERHTQRLEQDIVEDPITWLWSHRRWKHKRPTNV